MKDGKRVGDWKCAYYTGTAKSGCKEWGTERDGVREGWWFKEYTNRSRWSCTNEVEYQDGKTTGALEEKIRGFDGQVIRNSWPRNLDHSVAAGPAGQFLRHHLTHCIQHGSDLICRVAA